MKRGNGPEGNSGEQISTERLRLHNLGLLALSGREQGILKARQAKIALTLAERLRIMEILGEDPYFSVPGQELAAEPLSDIGYIPRRESTPPSERLLYVAM